MRLITDTFSESNQAVSARSVYVALTELASDNQCESFTANKALIAHRAGVSVRTADTILNGLRELGVLAIQSQRQAVNAGVIKAANSYTLLAIGNGCASTIGNGCKQPSISDKVEESERILEEKEKNQPQQADNDFLKVWNSQEGLPKILRMTAGRRKALQARMSEPFFRANWRAAIARVAASDWCKGGGDKGWLASADWFLSKPDNVVKAIEGKYDNQQKAKAYTEPDYAADERETTFGRHKAQLPIQTYEEWQKSLAEKRNGNDE